MTTDLISMLIFCLDLIVFINSSEACDSFIIFRLVDEVV